jgi:hypothetical protein
MESKALQFVSTSKLTFDARGESHEEPIDRLAEEQPPRSDREAEAEGGPLWQVVWPPHYPSSRVLFCKLAVRSIIQLDHLPHLASNKHFPPLYPTSGMFITQKMIRLYRYCIVGNANTRGLPIPVTFLAALVLVWYFAQVRKSILSSTLT